MVTLTKEAKALAREGRVEGLRTHLARSGVVRFNLEAIPASDVEEMASLVEKATVRSSDGHGSGWDQSKLSDKELGRYVRLLQAVQNFGTGQAKPAHVEDSLQRQLRELYESTFPGEPDGVEGLRSFGEQGELTGQILSSKTLAADVGSGILWGADVAVLAYCLWAIQACGGGEARVQGGELRLSGEGRTFGSCVDHLTVNEWLDSLPDGRGYRVRIGPRGKDAAAQARRWFSAARKRR